MRNPEAHWGQLLHGGAAVVMVKGVKMFALDRTVVVLQVVAWVSTSCLWGKPYEANLF